MQTFLIISPHEEEAREYIDKKCKNENIHDLDRSFFSLQFDKKKGESATSFTIENVREIQKKVFLRPLKGEKKAIILTHADLLTIPAQNALLKMLEEPPQDTLIFLISDSPDVLLPTILSRCFQVSLTSDIQTKNLISSEDIKKWKNLKPQSALKLAEILAKDSQKCALLLEQSIPILREQLLTKISNGEDSLWEQKTLNLLMKTHKTLTRTNTNTRLCLENFFLLL